MFSILVAGVPPVKLSNMDYYTALHWGAAECYFMSFLWPSDNYYSLLD